MRSSSAAEAAIGAFERRYINLTGFKEPVVQTAKVPLSLIQVIFARIGAFFQWLFRCESWVPSALKACRMADTSECEKSTKVANRILQLEECRYVVRKITGKPNEALARRMHEFLFYNSSDQGDDFDVIEVMRRAVKQQLPSLCTESPVILSGNSLGGEVSKGTDFSQLSIYKLIQQSSALNTPPLSRETRTPELVLHAGAGAFTASGLYHYQTSAEMLPGNRAFEPFSEIRAALKREDPGLVSDLLENLNELESRGEPQTEEGKRTLGDAISVIKHVCIPNFHSSSSDNSFLLMKKVLAHVLKTVERTSPDSISLTSLQKHLDCIKDFFADRIQGEDKDKIVALIETIEQNIRAVSLRQGVDSAEILKTVKIGLSTLLLWKDRPDLGVDNINSTLESVKNYLQKVLMGSISLSSFDHPD